MRAFEELEADLNYRFRDQRLLEQALTHSSHAHEQNTGADNEQLEFLGDAILGFVVSDLLYHAHPGLTEGQLSKLKGFFVSSANLVKYSEQLRLGQYLHLGKGEEKTGGRTKQALLVDAFEAVLGALYLDGGLEASRHLIERFFSSQIAETGDAEHQLSDFKTALQQRLQSHSQDAHYRVASETGPDHQKLFTVEIDVGGQTIAHGIGLTKKAAEQAAARHALQTLQRNEGMGGPSGCEEAAQRCTELNRTVGPTLNEQEHCTNDGNHIQEIDGTRVL